MSDVEPVNVTRVDIPPTMTWQRSPAMTENISFVCVARTVMKERPPVVATVIAMGDGSWPIGWLSWDVEDEGGVVGFVYVLPWWRRRGLARLLWQQADQIAHREGWPSPRHSPVRSLEGDAWAIGIGGHLPEASDEIHAFDEVHGP